MLTLYGIKNCDTVKKAKKWLDDNQVQYQFHDFRSDGITQPQIELWLTQIAWDKLLNKRSTTYRQLPDDVKNNLSENNVAELLAEQPTLIKRPVVEHQQTYSVGFNAANWQDNFAKA